MQVNTQPNYFSSNYNGICCKEKMLVPFPDDVNENPALIVWAGPHLNKKA